jgi:hypothetical protein
MDVNVNGFSRPHQSDAVNCSNKNVSRWNKVVLNWITLDLILKLEYIDLEHFMIVKCKSWDTLMV